MAEFETVDETTSWNFPKQEEKVLEYWRKIDAFQESMRQSERENRPIYSFYDGPPFATGLPHHGHILMGTIKDVVTRFAHANGFYVERRFGWDTHGLPVEHEIDKKLGIKSRDDVMALGIDKYNEECRAIVMRYSSEWRKTVERLGRWIDFDNDYKTMDQSFMESVWWVFSELWKKGLVYRGYRVMPYTTGCTTPLSNFEAGLEYRDVSDPAVFVSFPLVEDPETKLVAWTTTPWTLPSNLSVAVNPDLTYVKVKDPKAEGYYILAEDLLKSLWKDPKKAQIQTLEKYKGKDMAGWEYKPLFDYYVAKYRPRGAFRVLVDGYVTATAGTGIVHNAPAFGEDDHRVAIASGIVGKDEEPPMPMTDSGAFKPEIDFVSGVYFKDADKIILQRLKENGRVVSQGSIVHSYPFCWRSHTPLMYRVIPAWFVRVAEHQDKLVEANKQTRWVPSFVGENRFQNWLAQARDWNISRNRYWGTPLPVWANEDFSEMVCVHSVDELKKLTGDDTISDLHRHNIDHLTIPSKDGKSKLHRVEEVFDCWFESGSMPYAQQHYPFEEGKIDKFKNSFPADFVSEAIDQTRGWFYTLLVLGVHLFGTAPWKNLIVCGHVLAADGKKMSKSLKNYPDPTEVIDTYGSDALRMFLINSPVVRGDTLRFREEGVREVNTYVLLPYVNAYKFFIGHANLLKKEFGVDYVYDPTRIPTQVMDQWIISRCMSLAQALKNEMDAYRLYTIVPQVIGLVQELTNWYIRVNRPRLKGHDGQKEAEDSLHALYEALFMLTRMLAPFVPFTTENVYQGLRQYINPDHYPKELGNDLRSVHFLPYPEIRQNLINADVERRVSRMQNVIELGRVIRDRKTISLKTPLQELLVFSADKQYRDDIESLASEIATELNVLNVNTTDDEHACGIQYQAIADWPVLGKKLRKDAATVKKALPHVSSEEIKNFAETGHICIAGIDLDGQDLNVIRTVKNDDDAFLEFMKKKEAQYEINSDPNVVVYLDVKPRHELSQAGIARELVNRVQRLRKKAGLTATDDVASYFTGSDCTTLNDVLSSQKASLEKVLKTCVPKNGTPDSSLIITSEPQVIADPDGDIEFNLTLAWHNAEQVANAKTKSKSESDA